MSCPHDAVGRVRLIGTDWRGNRIDEWASSGETIALPVYGGKVLFRHNGNSQSGILYAHMTYISDHGEDARHPATASAYAWVRSELDRFERITETLVALDRELLQLDEERAT